MLRNRLKSWTKIAVMQGPHAQMLAKTSAYKLHSKKLWDYVLTSGSMWVCHGRAWWAASLLWGTGGGVETGPGGERETWRGREAAHSITHSLLEVGCRWAIHLSSCLVFTPPVGCHKWEIRSELCVTLTLQASDSPFIPLEKIYVVLTLGQEQRVQLVLDENRGRRNKTKALWSDRAEWSICFLLFEDLKWM